jgi:transcription initiation factor TFIIB
MAERTAEQEGKQLDDGRTEGYVCPECDSAVFDQGATWFERVCSGCGLVVEERHIDHSPEWRAYNRQERQQKSRVGAPMTELMHDKGLSTDIDWKDEDHAGRSLSSEKRAQVNRLRVWQERIRTRNASERNLKFALGEIDRMGSALGVPQSIRETASVVYRRAMTEDLIRGRSAEGIATAALYVACRQERIPRSLEEVSEVSRVEQKEIGRTYRCLAQELGLEMHPVGPEQYVPRFCSALGLSKTVQQTATEIIDATVEQGLLSGKSPTGYAGAAIYAASLSCEEPMTQEEVADVAGVTTVTLRNRYYDQVEALDELPIQVSDRSEDAIAGVPRSR